MSPSVVADFAEADEMAHLAWRPIDFRILGRLKQLEHIVMEIQRLKGIRGEPGKCDDAYSKLEERVFAQEVLVFSCVVGIIACAVAICTKVWRLRVQINHD